jgi:hypothetical protein
LAVIGSCLAVYAVFAVVFHSFIEPTVKTQAVAPYEPSARNTQPSATAFAVRSEPAQRVTAKQRTSPTIATTRAGPETTASIRAQASRANPSLSTPSRVAPPMTVTAAPPQPAETARAEAPSRVAPPMTVTAAPPQPAETARVEAPSRVAPPMMAAGAVPPSAQSAGSGQSSLGAPEGSTSVAVAAPESTATTPKKPVKKVARKTPQQPRRDFWNPMNFFAWGSGNGARQSY